MAKETKGEKDGSIHPIRRVHANISVKPEKFLIENRHLKTERIIEQDKLIPILPLEDPCKAMFIVCLTWFDSPLRGYSDIGQRIMLAAEWSGGLDNSGKLKIGWDPRKKEGEKIRTQMNRFLTFQQDFHHAAFIKLELLYNDIYESAMRNVDSEEKVAAFKSLVAAQKEVEFIRISNYKCKVNLDDLRESYSIDENEERAPSKKMPALNERKSEAAAPASVEST